MEGMTDDSLNLVFSQGWMRQPAGLGQEMMEQSSFRSKSLELRAGASTVSEEVVWI